MSKYIDLRTQAQHLLLAIDETEQGNAALEQRDFERAMVHFQQVLTLEPENAEARRLFEKAERGKATQVREAAMKKAALRAMLTVMGIGLFGFLLYMTVISWGPAAYHQVMSVYGPSPTFTATATHTLTPTPTATFTYTSTPTKTYTPTPTYTYTPTFTPTSTVTQTPTPTPVIVILTGNVWMFAEPDPDENTPRVGSLVRNTLVQVLAVQGDWVKVKSINYEGWVTRQYVGFTSSPPSDMVTPAPPTRTPRPRTPTPTATKAP